MALKYAFKYELLLKLCFSICELMCAVWVCAVCVHVCYPRLWWTGTLLIRRCWLMNRWMKMGTPGGLELWWSRSYSHNGSSRLQTMPRYDCTACVWEAVLEIHQYVCDKQHLNGWPETSCGQKWAAEPSDNNHGWHFSNSSCSPASLVLQSDPWRPSFIAWHLYFKEKETRSLSNTTRWPGWLMRSLHL